MHGHVLLEQMSLLEQFDMLKSDVYRIRFQKKNVRLQ